MLTKSQKSAFKVLKYGFSYLYPSPFDWDLELSQAKLSPFELNRTWIPFLFMMSLNLIVSIACFYVPLSHYVIQSRSHYGLFLTAVHLLSGTFMLGIFIVAFLLYTEWSAFDKLLNEFLSLKNQILGEIGCPQKEFLVDQLMVPAAIVTCIGPIIVILCGPFLELDAFCFVFQDVLPDPKFRNRSTILLVYIARTCLLSETLNVVQMARSDFESKYNIFPSLTAEQVEDVLKNEVGLIQGRRLPKKKLNDDTDFHAGGDVDFNATTKVLRMNCKPLNQLYPFGSPQLAPSDEGNSEYAEMKMLFKGFCARLGVNLFPSKEVPVHQHPAGHHNQGGGGGGGLSRIRLTVKSGRSGTTSHTISPGSAAAGGGGGGGGRRPPKRPPSRRSSSETASSSQEDISSKPSTSTESISTASSLRTGPPQRNFGKRKKSRRPTNMDKSDKFKRSRITLAESATPLSSSSTSAFIHIHTYGASGKPKKSVNLGRNVRGKNPFPRSFSTRHKPLSTRSQRYRQPRLSPGNGISIKEIRHYGDRRPSAIRIRIPLSFGRGSWRSGGLYSTESNSSFGSTISKRRKKGNKRGFNIHLRHSLLLANIGDLLKQMERERDHEWLDWTSTEDSYDEDEEHQDDHKKDRRVSRLDVQHLQQDLRHFLDATQILDKINWYMGLSPYVKVDRDGVCIDVKWDPKSMEFIGVCLNSILFFIITLSIFWSLTIIFGYEKGEQSTTHNIVKLEFANHFTEALFMLLISIFLSIWSISCVMELGIHYAEFFSRFNLAIRLLKYDVTEGIHEMIVRQLKSVGIFLGCFALLFIAGRTKTEVVREMCGFIGFCLLRPFSFTIRESVFYPFAEILGLIVFCYCFLCLNVVLLQFLVYSKALGNMAKRWNLRLAYAFGRISERANDDEEFVRVKKVIPFKKLYAEHIILVSLYRNLGHVNAIVFNGFVFCVSTEIILVIFLLFSLFTSEALPPSTTKYLSSIGDLDIPVPLRLYELKGEELFKTLILFALTMTAFWLFGGVLHVASDNLHIGIEYVRRQGLILCRASRQRRFILSMINSYSPKHLYWIGQSFHFNREFLVGLIAFVIGLSMVTVTFSPDRTAFSHITTCTADGKCTVLFIPSGAENLIYEIGGSAPPKPLPAPPPEPPSTTLPPLQASLTETYAQGFQIFTPCASFGTYPVKESLHFHTVCPANWPTLPELTMGTIFKRIQFQGHKLYGQVSDPFGSDETIAPERCRSLKQKDYNFKYESTFGQPRVGEIVDCFTKPLLPEDFDDCGNPRFFTPNALSEPLEPVLRVVLPEDVPSVTRNDAILCCYEYPGVAKAEEQGKVCNMPNSTLFTEVCHYGAAPERGRMKGHVLLHHDRILRRIHYEKVSGNNNFIKDNEKIIQNCLCRLHDPQVPLDSLEHCQCSGMEALPCISQTNSKKVSEDDYSIKCGSVRVPILFKTNPPIHSFVFRSEHQRYKAICSGPEFTDRFEHDDKLSYSSPCPPSVSLDLTDCAGKPIQDLNKDDCQNWLIETPDTSTGVLTMKMASVHLKLLSYNPTTKKFVPSSGWNEKAVICCFIYAGKSFQTPDQNRFCNAPTLNALNSAEWCKAVADNNGRRIPGSFVDARKYDQLLRKYLLTAEYHRRKGTKPDWMGTTGVAEKWRRCMCSNKIPGFGGTPEFEEARVECNTTIVTPRQLYNLKAFDFWDAFPKCKHNWPSYTLWNRISYPAVFIFQDGIWEKPDRFHKKGDPTTTSSCYINPSSVERFPNDGNIFDLDLVPIKADKLDECGMPPFRTPLSNANGRLVEPELHPRTESSMYAYDTSSTELQNSEWVHCCYDYWIYSETSKLIHQHDICNLPSAAAVIEKCRGRSSNAIRKRHEKEYVKLIAFILNGAYFRGNRVVKPTYPFDLNRKKKWRLCICESHPDDKYNCEKQYLPPCLKPRGNINTNIVKLEDTFAACPGGWRPDLIIRYPIIRKWDADDDLNTVVVDEKLFRVGSLKVDCPNERTTIYRDSNKLTDCYGHSLPLPARLEVDDCKNPNIPTPSKNDLTQRVYPVKRLIAMNRMPPPRPKNESFFCCFDYAIAENTLQTQLCNLPSLDAVNQKCKLTYKDTTRILELKFRRRSSGKDILGLHFDNRIRRLWTECMCENNEASCKAAVREPIG
ncbi:unnamed protein product [Orchesella dallaii]|uniref:Uncharacterized protein n=1 Tax=Orchesella dallaii TaxID=48710 RepID=A0ABP1RPH0_9HEXA